MYPRHTAVMAYLVGDVATDLQLPEPCSDKHSC